MHSVLPNPPPWLFFVYIRKYPFNKKRKGKKKNKTVMQEKKILQYTFSRPPGQEPAYGSNIL
jgi:hypothetical protein